jgi:hypothetical protein
MFTYFLYFILPKNCLFNTTRVEDWEYDTCLLSVSAFNWNYIHKKIHALNLKIIKKTRS